MTPETRHALERFHTIRSFQPGIPSKIRAFHRAQAATLRRKRLNEGQSSTLPIKIALIAFLSVLRVKNVSKKAQKFSIWNWQNFCAQARGEKRPPLT